MGGVAIVVFSDLVDSTALLATLGDDRMDAVRRAHLNDVAGAVSAAGGRVVKTLGDGVMATFESALGALRAAAGIQAAVERLDDANGGIGIAVRVGVAAGEPIPDGEDLHGMTVVIASRLSSVAGSGEVLVQDLVQALVASRDGVALDGAGEYELKGVPAPVRASRLLWRELSPVTVEDGDGEAAGEAPERASSSAGMRLPPILAAYGEEPLIGRDQEIEALREATAPTSGRRAVLVLGEPGIGKTRHAAAVATEAHERGEMVVLARCPPEAVVPFEPWVRAIGELARAGDDAWREELAKAAGPELAALVPQLAEHAVAGERALSSELVAAEGGRYRLLEGIGSALGRAAGEARLHVVLDDAHWCDPASAQALGHLLEGAPSGLVLVATARDRELGRGHPVSRVLSDLRRTGDLTELRLAGLDAPGLAALVGARVGRAITPALAARLQARTAGNPFFAGELACDLDGRGVLREGEMLDSAPVPDAVTDLVEERLARLDPNTERLLAAVAAIGPAAPVALAAEAAGLDREAAERAVVAALSERLVDEVVATRPTIAFPHALVREALIAGTPDAARARLHLAIARALEKEPGAEPGDLARHYGLSVELAGPEPAVAAYRTAAAAAAEGHDHEQAAVHLRSALALTDQMDLAARAPLLLELGEQELLSADLVRARGSFRGAIEAAQETGDATTQARASLGFAGGMVGFGWEVGTDDPAAVELLREGFEALGDAEPLLKLQMIFRLVYLLIYTEDDDVMPSLVERASELARRLGDSESQVVAQFVSLIGRFARSPDPMEMFGFFEEAARAGDLAASCERDDLRFRVELLSAAFSYALARIPQCEEAIERAAEIANRLGSPRFTCEVDFHRAQRLLDRGDRAAGEALIRRAGAVVRRLRPDIHIAMELAFRVLVEWIYEGETSIYRSICETMEEVIPRGLTSSMAVMGLAVDGDYEIARERMWNLLGGAPESLRRPDGHVPITICLLAQAATIAGDREAAERLRPLIEPMRTHLIQAIPAVGFGQLPELYIGRLESMAGRLDAAREELLGAVERADDYGGIDARVLARFDLGDVLERLGDHDAAASARAEAEAMVGRYGLERAWVDSSRIRTDADAASAGPVRPQSEERPRPIRALATRGGRRALASMVGRLDDDAELERRFSEPRRQRALLKAMARGFQPARAEGFEGTIAFELEPFAIEPPSDAPWRWAIAVDSRAGRARLLEPAPLDATVTFHFGLAQWLRVLAGLENALTAMVAGHCSVEGDVIVATRMEAMFGV